MCGDSSITVTRGRSTCIFAACARSSETAVSASRRSSVSATASRVIPPATTHSLLEFYFKYSNFNFFMQLRTAVLIAFAVGLLAVWLAIYRADAYAAWVALAAAVVGAGITRFYPTERDTEDEAVRAAESAQELASGATPNVAAAVAAGEVHAAALLEVTMDS